MYSKLVLENKESEACLEALNTHKLKKRTKVIGLISWIILASLSILLVTKVITPDFFKMIMVPWIIIYAIYWVVDNILFTYMINYHQP